MFRAKLDTDYRSPELMPDADHAWKVPPFGKEMDANYDVPDPVKRSRNDSDG